MTGTHPPDDGAEQALVARASAGDRQAFRTLVERFERDVAATVVAMLGSGAEVDDVVQEVFIRFYEALPQFRGEAKVSTYLKRIAINRSLDELRRRKRTLARFLSRDDASASVPEQGAEGDDEVERRERRALVHRAIQSLPPKHRAVVVLRLIEGYSTEETAEMLGVAYGTVLSRLNRARNKLKTVLKPYLENPPSEAPRREPDSEMER
ncbi:RNA polymerase sigma factor [Rhodocaloribacter sp.]